MEPWALRQPGAHFWMLVGRVIVHDQVEIEISGDRFLNLAKKAQVLLMPVTRLALRDHLAGGHVKGSKQGGGAVSNVVMGDSLYVPKTQPLRGSRWLRKQWLGSIEGLHLGLLVPAQSTTALSGGFR